MRISMTMAIAVLLAALVAIGACAENPADSVPAAQVSDADTSAERAEQPTDEAAAEEAGKAGDVAGEAGDVAGEAGDVAGEDTAGASGASTSIPLTGNVAAIGSRVTGSHYLVFEDWEGLLTLGGSPPETASLQFTVQTGSVVVDPDSRGPMTGRLESHLASEDFFAVEQYPTASFVSTSIVEGGEGDATHTVTGELTVRGITREIAFPATVTVTDDQVSAVAEFSLNRLDFDIAYPGQPDDLIREEVVLQIDVEGAL